MSSSVEKRPFPGPRDYFAGLYDLSQLPVCKDRAVKANNSTSKGSFKTNMYQITIKFIKIILSSHRNSLLPVILFLFLPTNTAPLPDL